MPLQFRQRTVVLTTLSVLAIMLFLLLVPPLHQYQSYHAFADQRTILGISNFWDTLSNLPFAVIGLMGLFTFRDLASRTIFFGILGTALGSAYYHLRPDDARLFWDRLPMTVVFMSVFALAIKQRALVIPFVLVGVASIVWWRITGNLWPYALVQFGPMIALIVIAFRSEPRLRPVVVFYGLSKIAEFLDTPIYGVFPLSGHTLKHLLAGVAAWYIYRWIKTKSLQSALQPAVANVGARS